ncbi:unnamed protein product [Owenia fusiformis]|uniref:Cilia- and flagella-associated protein 300 n=1 Tax=Owenia fusiformis TaxID=6347 RepID=A0A8J1UH30_OWEFU|nr:unnamed protein product [Owenia fusiformis]
MSTKFTFQHLEGKKFNSLENKETQDLLMKWSMKGRIKAQCFTFDQQFQSYEKDTFVKDFFSDPIVKSSLQVVSGSGSWVPIGIQPTGFESELVSCSTVSLTFFDRLWEHDIVRENKQIRKCLDEYYEGIQISDELRKMLLLEDSDNYDIFDEKEREEFLFLLFKHICIDLISVQKDQKTNQIVVTSIILKVTLSDDNGPFFPADEEHVQNFAYLIVDPILRHVTTFYHKFGSGDLS